MKILFLKGLPASGKSTFAKELVAKEPDVWVRVNKDSLRKMLHDGKFSKGREKIVEQMHRNTAEKALSDGLSVIVDDTNFSPRHEETFRQMAERYNAEFEIKEFDTTVEECIERDNKRADHVGKDVILKMFHQGLCKTAPVIREDLRTAAIFDMDGTLAIMHNRGPFEWAKVGNDLPNSPVMQALFAFEKYGVAILIVSGRDESCRKETMDWLARSGVTPDALFMRPIDDMRKDTIIKQEIYDREIKGHCNVLAVFDDRPCVVRFWRSQGLFVFDCGNGIEF